jgi:parallel beta-helix repeat protein
MRRHTNIWLFLVATLLARTAVASTYYVSPNGSDSNPGTTADQPWKTLHRISRTNLAFNDQILLARGGTWHEFFSVPTDGITVAAYGTGDRPIIDADNPSRDLCLDINRSHFTLRSIQISHAHRADRGAISVYADHNLTGIHIEDCIISDNAGRGIWIAGPKQYSVRDIEIIGNQFLRNDASGVLLVLAEDSDIRRNLFINNCQKPIEPWQAGIRIWSDGIRNLMISYNLIRDQRNHLDNDSAMGIHCDETGRVVIRNNLILNVDHAGIEVENTRGITVENNAVIDANIGIFINRAGHDHIVRNNTIFDSRSMAIFLHAWQAHGVDAGPEISVDGRLLTRNRVENNICLGSHLAELKAIDGAEIIDGPLANIYCNDNLGPERKGFIEWGNESFDRYDQWPPAKQSPP